MHESRGRAQEAQSLTEFQCSYVPALGSKASYLTSDASFSSSVRWENNSVYHLGLLGEINTSIQVKLRDVPGTEQNSGSYLTSGELGFLSSNLSDDCNCAFIYP